MVDEPPLPTPLPEGARCAIHPDREAAQTCVRCGNYMCSACTSEEPEGFCLTCASRLAGVAGDGPHGFPFSRDHFTLDGLINLSLSRWKANWVPLTIGFGVICLAWYAIGLGGEFLIEKIADAAGSDSPLHSEIHPARLAFHVAESLVHVASQLVMFGVALDVMQGRPIELERAFEPLQRLPALLLQIFMMYLALGIDVGLHFLLWLALGGQSAWATALAITIGVWFALLPLRVYVGLGIMFTTPILIADPESTAISSFVKSWRIVAGHRLQAFGVSLACAFIVGAGILACCVGAFVSVPIATLLYTALFLALSNETRSALPHEGWHV